MKKSREELEKELAKATAKLEQYQHRGQRLENRLGYYQQGERRKRAHRLITRGAAVKASVDRLRPMIQAVEAQTVNVQSFLKIVKKYTEPVELMPTLLREFISKIVVHAPDKSSGRRIQRIDVHYNSSGKSTCHPNLANTAKKQSHDTKVSCDCSLS